MKKITLLLAFIFIGGMIYGQNGPSLLSTNTGTETFLNNPAGSASEALMVNNAMRATTVVVTHSNTQSLLGVGIACNGRNIVFDNSFYRDFDLVNDFGIIGDFNVTNAEVGIQQLNSVTGSFTLTANIYSSYATFPLGNLTLLGTGSINALNADAGTVVSIPVTAIVGV